MVDNTKMEESPQDADYFVQINELYDQFRLVTKKLNQSESPENASNVDEDNEKENVDHSEWIRAAQKLSDAILGCLDAKLDGLPSGDLHYYRLLGMKSSILVERSKILAAMDEDEESFKVLDEALSLVVGIPPRPEISYVTLRLVNHFAYTLSVDEQFDKAKRVLLAGERVYAQIDEDAVHAGFLSCDDLFMPECAVPAPRVECAEFLERLATNNMQMLGFVHGRLGDWTRFACCGHLALRRQLERREGDALTWTARAARLAINFVTRSRYREALTHLAAATNVLEAYEADLRSVELNEEVEQKIAEVELRVGDLGRAWTKFALQLLDASSKDADERESSGSSSSSTSSSSSEEESDIGVQRPSEDLQERGDAVDLSAKDAVEFVDVFVDEEGDHKTVPALGKVEEVDDDKGEEVAKEECVVDIRVVIGEQVEASSELAPIVDEGVEKKDAGEKDAVDKDTVDKDAVEKGVEAKGVEEKGVEEKDVEEKEAVEKEAVEAERGGRVEFCALLETTGSDEEDDDSDYFSFPTLDLSYIFDVVPCELVGSAEKARCLVQYVTGWSERVMTVYDVRAQPEMHVAAALDHVELLRHLANYAPSEAAYQLHRSRSAILEQVCDQLKEACPEAYQANCGALYRDLADVQLEMMTLNLRRLEHVDTEALAREAAMDRLE